jgi:CHAT domain-containing protein
MRSPFSLLANIAGKSRVAAASQALSKILIASAASKLGKKRLVIVSEGALQYIPFAALSLPTKAANLPLVSEHEIVTLPSASTITALRSDKITKRQPAPKPLAIFADPVFSREDDRVKQAMPITPIPITQIPIDLQLAAKSIAETGIKSDRLPQTRTEAEQILKLVPKSESSYLVDFFASRN